MKPVYKYLLMAAMVQMKRKAKIEDVDYARTFASPPCFTHEADRAYLGISCPPEARQRPDVKRWCKAERAHLIGDRLAIAAAAHRLQATRTSESLKPAIGHLDRDDIRMGAVVTEDGAFAPASVTEDGAA
jgi:hypothetical protein